MRDDNLVARQCETQGEIKQVTVIIKNKRGETIREGQSGATRAVLCRQECSDKETKVSETKSKTKADKTQDTNVQNKENLTDITVRALGMEYARLLLQSATANGLYQLE